MNICFLIGKIVSDIEFKFILNSKKNSITMFYLEIEKNCHILVKGYDEIADECYRNLYKNDNISIYGEIKTEGEIEIVEIEKIE